MYNFLLKNGTAVAMGVGSLITVLFLIFSFSGLSSAGYDAGADLLAGDYKNLGAFNFGLNATYFLFAVAAILMIGGVIYDLILSRKTSFKMILGIIALIIIFVILYSISKFETDGKWASLNNEFGIVEYSSKLVSAGIWTCVILMILAILSIAVSEVRNFFK